MTTMLENDLAQNISRAGPLRLPAPAKGRISLRFKSFPIAPLVTLKPDDKAQNWLLNISASDKLGLLYSVARVLGRHQVDVLLAKVATLGERVDDSFLLRGAALQHNKAQIAMETELLEILGGQIRPNHRSTSGLIDS
jgi:[protein-PII] uridylyltransferase